MCTWVLHGFQSVGAWCSSGADMCAREALCVSASGRVALTTRVGVQCVSGARVPAVGIGAVCWAGV